MKLHMLTFLLMVVGGLNWLMVGLFQWEVADLFGGQSDMISRAIYVVVGLATVYELFMHKQSCRECGKSESQPTAA